MLRQLLFDTGDDILIPDEKTLGRIVQEQDLDTSLMVAVGSGVINDSVKFVTSCSDFLISLLQQLHLWMDMLQMAHQSFHRDIKYSPVAHLTYGLVGDTDIFKDCTTGFNSGRLR